MTAKAIWHRNYVSVTLCILFHADMAEAAKSATSDRGMTEARNEWSGACAVVDDRSR